MTVAYIAVFIVDPDGRKKMEPLPQTPEKQAHTITLGGCFTVFTVNLLRYLLEPVLLALSGTWG